MREIGSEFSFTVFDAGKGIEFPRKGTLTFSGRTAIEMVLKKLPPLRTALLPSYCCNSMIEPFRRAGIKTLFFDVNYANELKINIDCSADVLLWCNYFGFKNSIPDFDGIIIEDITHSLFSDVTHHSQSDYLIASVRKWVPIYCGGYCSVEAELASPPKEFLQKKADAMNLKSEYLVDSEENKKTVFLFEFSESNKWLANKYSELGMDSYSREYISHVDVERQKAIRRKNAHILYEGLQNKVNFLFDEKKMDCPLFVPIVLRENRNEIRQYLAKEQIYCPIHWPHPNADCRSNLYDTEFSLICDQRYNENDMYRIVSVLSKII